MKLGKSPSFVFLIIILVAFAGNARGETAFLNVEWKNGLLSVNAKNIPLNEILKAISQKTGILMYGSHNLHDRTTASLSNQQPGDVIQKLLKPTGCYAIHISLSPEESFSPRIVFSKNAGLNNDIIMDLLLSTYKNRAIRLSASQEEASSYLLLLNNDATLNNNIIDTLISNFAGTDDADTLKTGTTAGSDSNKIPATSQELAAVGSDEEEDAAGEEERTNLVKHQLDHPKPEMRAAALQDLVYNIDSELGLEAAASALSDSDDRVRSIAEEIIREFKQDESDEEGGEINKKEL